MQKVINCSCGYIVRAENDDQLVAKAQEHAKQVHQMDLTRDRRSRWRDRSEWTVGRRQPAVACSCARMGFLVDVDQLLRVDVRVALGRAETGMAQQLLNRAKVGAVGEQMRGK